MAHKISSASLFEVINREANNHGSEFTIKSLRTGKDYTYKISRSLFKGNWYTHVKVETEYQNYIRLGFFSHGKIINKGQIIDSASAKAIAWTLDNVKKKNFNLLDNSIEVFHTGSCLVCGKKLTDANSIEIGLGPICRSK